MHPRVEYGGADPPLLERGSADEAGHAAADDGDRRIGRDRRGEDDLLLRERLLDLRPPGSPVFLLPPPSASSAAAS